jgi:hypothetical protein
MPLPRQEVLSSDGFSGKTFQAKHKISWLTAYSATYAKKEDNATRGRAFFYGNPSNLAE